MMALEDRESGPVLHHPIAPRGRPPIERSAVAHTTHWLVTSMVAGVRLAWKVTGYKVGSRKLVPTIIPEIWRDVNEHDADDRVFHLIKCASVC